VTKAVAEIAARVVAILEAVEPLQRVNVGVIRSCEPASLGSHIVDVDVATGYAELFRRSGYRRAACRKSAE